MYKLLFGVFLFFSAAAVHAAVKNLSNSDVKKMVAQGVPVIDIRRTEEWQQTGIIKGSHLLTFFDKNGHYDVHKWLAEFNKIVSMDEPFILICRSGNRTAKISKLLDEQLKYKQVSHVAKGIKNWISAGESTIKP